ncbi:protein REVEILLE 1-like [Aristolochia californica]|uniref:protein REVEILLE 1-like n=1 Tax=Aristolochia californica TaxID=171875 RepID=UPI0035DE3EB0
MAVQGCSVQERSNGTDLSSVIVTNKHMSLDPGRPSTEGVQVQVKELYLSGDEPPPKARKPYTITKQRERWTEEEHKKFLEALKLYGRAWRRIEEHIGTKTAVQIRSHAQKFFSKVTQESGDGNSGSVKAIEIPPPRPKRKPMHPYPRKMVHSSSTKCISVSEHAERSSSPLLSEQENGSPTSVLSAVGSDTMGFTVSNIANACSSPVSSAARSNPTGMLIAEQENGYPSSVEEENRSSSPVLAVPDSSQPSRSHMKVEIGGNQTPIKANSSIEAPKTCLKLFGRTVLVTEPHRPSTVVRNTSLSPRTVPAVGTESHYHNPEAEDTKLTKSIGEITGQRNCTEDSSKSAGNPWSFGVSPLFYCMQLLREDSNATEANTNHPCWAMNGFTPLPFMQCSNEMNSRQSPDSYMEGSDEKETNKERSWSGSNTTSVGEVGTAEKSGDVDSKLGEGFYKEKDSFSVFCLKPSKNSAFAKPKLENGKRGFVPYKRCISEREREQSEVDSEEREGQRIRLCL